MSKAFTKDDDAPDAPLLIPRRAPLPPGTPNYVTARGLALLKHELSLEKELVIHAANASDAERARAAALHTARVAELEQRLATALVVESHLQPKDEVRFGATVAVRSQTGAERQYRIVGVDEANAAQGAIAFVAPLARSLLGKREGDAALLKTPGGEEELEILTISYE